jgi:hypothetical protein
VPRPAPPPEEVRRSLRAQPLACLENADHVAAAHDPVEPSVGHHGELVDVLAGHDLEGVRHRRVRADGVQVIQRTHGLGHGDLPPALPGNLLHLVGRNETDHGPTVHDHEATAPRAQEIVHELMERELALDPCAVALHDVPDAHAAQAVPHLDLTVAGAGRVQEEPADEGDPEAPEAGPREEAEQAVDDEEVGDQLSAAGGKAGRPSGIARHPPGEGAQDAPSVERIARDQVENGQGEVDVAQPIQDGLGRGGGARPRVPAHCPGQEEADDAQHRAREGPHDADQELGPRSLRLSLDPQALRHFP